MEEGPANTALVDYNTTHNSSPDCHVFMASIDELDNDSGYRDELEQDVFGDEINVDTPQDEDYACRAAKMERKCKQGLRRQNAAARV